MSGYYGQAAICRRGHIQTRNVEYGKYEQRCPTCGAPVLLNCLACNFRIRGTYEIPGVVVSGDRYKKPDFCDQCGEPHPWAGRQARIYQMHNLLDEGGLSSADELVVREQLEALLEEDLPAEEQVRRWKRVKNVAPAVFDSEPFQRILGTVTEAVIKSQL
jgi:hypothetical protein